MTPHLARFSPDTDTAEPSELAQDLAYLRDGYEALRGAIELDYPRLPDRIAQELNRLSDVIGALGKELAAEEF